MVSKRLCETKPPPLRTFNNLVSTTRPWKKIGQFAERESLQPDLGRAIRATVAFMAPWALVAIGWPPLEVTFVAIAAQNIAMVDVRGAYRLRLTLLLAMTAVFAGAAALGTATSGNFVGAILATILIATCNGLWRHLSSDYGMSLAISSSLVFLLALAPAEPGVTVKSHALAAALGGLWGLALQVADWPFRPQHPLRLTVSDTWLAVAELFEAIAPLPPEAQPTRHQRINQNEASLRTTLDKAYAILAGARVGRLRQQLEALNLAAARLATRVMVLNTALETLLSPAELAAFSPNLQPALTSLTNSARSIALGIVSRRPAHLATFEVRLRRLTHLLRVLQARVTSIGGTPGRGTQLQEILRQIEEVLSEIHQALRVTVEPLGERSAFSLELRDVETWTLRPLAATLNLSRRVDPALMRFTLRLAVLLVFGVAIFKAYDLPHGYWLPFTIIVVLQPDYGSTRQRAAQRVAGTLAGSALASGVLWLHLSFVGISIALAASIFAFGYFVKRNYAIAVIFITLFVTLLTESHGTVSVEFTFERLAATLAGGMLALIAALFFWPVWERDRFPPVLAAALRANEEFLHLIVARLVEGGSYDAEAIAAKRKAESANSVVFSSLQRMTGDPRNQREGLEHAATLANGNQRLTRALTFLTLQLPGRSTIAGSCLPAFAELATDALATIATAVEKSFSDRTRIEMLLTRLEKFRFPLEEEDSTAGDATRHRRWALEQLMRAGTELSALLLEMRNSAPEKS